MAYALFRQICILQLEQNIPQRYTGSGLQLQTPVTAILPRFLSPVFVVEHILRCSNVWSSLSSLMDGLLLSRFTWEAKLLAFVSLIFCFHSLAQVHLFLWLHSLNTKLVVAPGHLCVS